MILASVGTDYFYGPRIVTTAVTLLVVFSMSLFFSKRIVRAVEDIGDTYTELYKQQHREVMEALKGETQKALADTKALVMEHTELERILRVLAERAAEDAVVEERRAAEDGLKSRPRASC